MSSDTKKFIKGVTSGYAFTIISMLVSLWMVPFTLKYLSKPEYGIFAIITDLLGWLSIANLGITSAFNSKGAQLLGTKNYNELNVVLSTTFFSQLFSALLIVIIGIFLVWNPNLLFGDIGSLEHIGIVVALTVLSFIISYVMQPLNSLLIADKQIHIDNYLRFGLLALRTILTIVFLISGFKLVSIAFSNLIGTLIIAIITWIRAKKTLSFAKIEFRLWQKSVFQFLLKNGIWFTIGGIAGILILRMDAFLIGKYISLAVVANFTISSKLYQIASNIHQQFFNTTRPYFSQIYGKNNFKKLNQLYDLVYYSSFLTAFIFGVFIFVLNKWFIGWWVGPEFYIGDKINLLIAINFILQSVVLPNRIILATTLLHIEIHNITRVLEGIIKIIISLLFIEEFEISGILIASIISTLLFSNSILNYIISKKIFNSLILSKLFPFIFIFLLYPIIFFERTLFMYIIILILTLGLTILSYHYIGGKVVFIENFEKIKLAFNKKKS